MEEFQIVVETIANTAVKYKYDDILGKFKVKKNLPLGMVFPYDFGFIPGTIGEDGDPLDAMLISEHKSFTGAQVTCRLIGALLARQTVKGKRFRNDRFFFVPVDSIVFEHVVSLQTFGSRHNQQLKDFFLNYNKAEGKTFTPLRIIPASQALRLIHLASTA